MQSSRVELQVLCTQDLQQAGLENLLGSGATAPHWLGAFLVHAHAVCG